MESSLYAILIFLGLALLCSASIYIAIARASVRRKMKKSIAELFNAKEYGEKGDALIFNYRDYDVIATFRGEVKLSIIHNREIGDAKAPKGMKLTPLYLIIKVRRGDEPRKLLDGAIEFLERA